MRRISVNLVITIENTWKHSHFSCSPSNTNQLLHHIASPHLRLPQAAAPAPVLGSCEDFTRLGTLRRHCLDCLECWHWHWHPMKHATLRNHGGQGSWQNNVSCQFKVGTSYYINIINLHVSNMLSLISQLKHGEDTTKVEPIANTLEHDSIGPELLRPQGWQPSLATQCTLPDEAGA